MGIGTFTQVNGIASAVTNFFDPNTSWAIHLVRQRYFLGGCNCRSYCNGMYGTCYYWRYQENCQCITSCCTVYGSALCCICCVVVTLQCYEKIPDAIVQIVQGAFGYGDGIQGIRAVAGGVLGAMMAAMQNGVAKGIFSNEAGLGSAPIAAAAAKLRIQFVKVLFQ